MIRRNGLALGLLVLSGTALVAVAGDDLRGSEGDGTLNPARVRIEFAPSADVSTAAANGDDRVLRKTVLADGTEVTHLDGRGMETLRLVDDGSGPRLRCGGVLASERKRRRDLPVDFRARALPAPGGSHDAR